MLNYCQNSERALPTIREFLESEQRIDNNPGLLPLVLICPRRPYRKCGINLKRTIFGSKRWKQDPRLIKLRNLRERYALFFIIVIWLLSINTAWADCWLQAEKNVQY